MVRDKIKAFALHNDEEAAHQFLAGSDIVAIDSETSVESRAASVEWQQLAPSLQSC